MENILVAGKRVRENSRTLLTQYEFDVIWLRSNCKQMPIHKWQFNMPTLIHVYRNSSLQLIIRTISFLMNSCNIAQSIISAVLSIFNVCSFMISTSCDSLKKICGCALHFEFFLYVFFILFFTLFDSYAWPEMLWMKIFCVHHTNYVNVYSKFQEELFEHVCNFLQWTQMTSGRYYH